MPTASAGGSRAACQPGRPAGWPDPGAATFPACSRSGCRDLAGRLALWRGFRVRMLRARGQRRILGRLFDTRFQLLHPALQPRNQGVRNSTRDGDTLDIRGGGGNRYRYAEISHAALPLLCRRPSSRAQAECRLQVQLELTSTLMHDDAVVALNQGPLWLARKYMPAVHSAE